MKKNREREREGERDRKRKSERERGLVDWLIETYSPGFCRKRL